MGLVGGDGVRRAVVKEGIDVIRWNFCCTKAGQRKRAKREGAKLSRLFSLSYSLRTVPHMII